MDQLRYLNHVMYERERLSAMRQGSQSSCSYPTDIMLDHFPLFSVLRSCSNFRAGNEIERLHICHDLVPLLFLWSIFRALLLY